MKPSYSICYHTQFGSKTGTFGITHARNFGIVLVIGEHFTQLSLKQLRELCIKPQDLFNFDQIDINERYDRNHRTTEQLKEIVKHDIDELIEDLFTELRQAYATAIGEITPMQLQELQQISDKLVELKNRLTRLMCHQIWQNRRV